MSKASPKNIQRISQLRNCSPEESRLFCERIHSLCLHDVPSFRLIAEAIEFCAKKSAFYSDKDVAEAAQRYMATERVKLPDQPTANHVPLEVNVVIAKPSDVVPPNISGEVLPVEAKDPFESIPHSSTSVVRRTYREILQDNTDLGKLLPKYRSNPRGIRNDPRMRDVCLKCGTNGAKPRSAKQTYFRVCQNPNCGDEWYVNRCWRCAKKGRKLSMVDSRDPVTSQCLNPNCGWWKCAHCGACSPTCDHTEIAQIDSNFNPSDVF